jgi:hypothetical protein
MWYCWMWAWYLEGCGSPEGVAVLDMGVVPGGGVIFLNWWCGSPKGVAVLDVGVVPEGVW